MQTAALIFLSALLSASSAQPLEYVLSPTSIPASHLSSLSLSHTLPPSPTLLAITNKITYSYSTHLTLTLP